MQSGSFPEGKRSGVSRSETKADVRDPIPRDERGWNVAPAPDGRRAKPTTLFKTEVPTFWNDNELAALLQSKSVQINAKSTSNGTSLLAELLLGFGPTLLIVGLFILVARRAARGGGMGALGNFGRSRARPVDPQKIRGTVGAVAGSAK